MNKLKLLSAIGCVALLGLMSASFADSNDCPSSISPDTSACLSQAATQQYVNDFNNYFATAQNMSQFSQSQSAPQATSPAPAAQPTNNNQDNQAQVSAPPPVTTDSKSYVAPLISNPDSKDKQKINWF